MRGRVGGERGLVVVVEVVVRVELVRQWCERGWLDGVGWGRRVVWVVRGGVEGGWWRSRVVRCHVVHGSIGMIHPIQSLLYRALNEFKLHQ